jgi:hypothetical protein
MQQDGRKCAMQWIVQPKGTELISECKWVEYKFHVPIVQQQFKLEVSYRQATVNIRTHFIRRPSFKGNAENMHFCLDDLINEAYRHQCAPTFQSMFKNRCKILGTKLEALCRSHSGVGSIRPFLSKFKFSTNTSSDEGTSSSLDSTMKSVDLLGAIVCLLSIGDPTFDPHFCSWLSGICHSLIRSAASELSLSQSDLCETIRNAMHICFGSDEVVEGDLDSYCEGCADYDQPWTFVFCQGLRLTPKRQANKSWELIRCSNIAHLCTTWCFPDPELKLLVDRLFLEARPMFCHSCSEAFRFQVDSSSPPIAVKGLSLVSKMIQHPWCTYLVDMEPESCSFATVNKLDRENWIDLSVVFAKIHAGQLSSISELWHHLAAVLDHADQLYHEDSVAKHYTTLVRISLDSVLLKELCLDD